VACDAGREHNKAAENGEARNKTDGQADPIHDLLHDFQDIRRVDHHDSWKLAEDPGLNLRDCLGLHPHRTVIDDGKRSSVPGDRMNWLFAPIRTASVRRMFATRARMVPPSGLHSRTLPLSSRVPALQIPAPTPSVPAVAVPTMNPREFPSPAEYREPQVSTNCVFRNRRAPSSSGSARAAFRQ